MSKIDDLINKLCPNGVEYQRIRRNYQNRLFKFYYGKATKGFQKI